MLAPEKYASDFQFHLVFVLINVKNSIVGSKVTANLLNGWILPVAEAELGRVCSQPA